MLPIEITADALHLIHSTILDRLKRYGDAIHPSLVWASSFPFDGSESFVTIGLSKEPFVGEDWLINNNRRTNIYNSLPNDQFDRAHRFLVSLSKGRLAIRRESK
jgi:hypothetical protein